MQTSRYRTRTEIVPNKYEMVQMPEDLWIIGLDSGYGGMKGFSPNKYFCFPSYAEKLDKDRMVMTMMDSNDIFYHDLDTDEHYLLGRNAQNAISKNDTNDTEGELFSRNRHTNKKFYVLCMAAIGIACMENKYGSGVGKELIIQGGLPPAYIDDGTASYIKMLSKPANFELTVGNNRTVEFHLSIKPENIFVTLQPKGTMASINIGNNGKYIPDAPKYMTGNLLVCDIGYNTMDIFGFKGHKLTVKESWNTYGMRAVLQMVAEEIKNEKGTDIRVPAMQKYLETGIIHITKELDMDAEDFSFDEEEFSFAPILERCSKTICNRALIQIANTTENYSDYNYLVITGGTGAAWFEWIQEKFKNARKLKIIPGNRNDNLDMLYANARGYYLFRVMAVNKSRKNKALPKNDQF